MAEGDAVDWLKILSMYCLMSSLDTTMYTSITVLDYAIIKFEGDSCIHKRCIIRPRYLEVLYP